MPAESRERARSFYGDAEAPPLPPDLEKQLGAQGLDVEAIRSSLGQMHQDIAIDGHRATGSGVPSVQYDFFALHPHNETVCGKAWHHEDRHDPGDMSKCFVKLALVDGALHLKVRMKDGLPDLDDPDLVDNPPIALPEGESACEADTAPAHNWGDWIIHAFVRP